MSNDFTSTLVLNLQQRVVCMENAIGFLTREVHRLSQPTVSQSFQTTIPLQPVPQGRRRYLPQPEPSISYRAPLVSHQEAQPVTLADILMNGEIVTFGIRTGRDASGTTITSTLDAVFDGTNLKVTRCDSVSALIGTSSTKPGEILFQFMYGLVDAGVLQHTFNALPWRLASVIRNGQTVTLAQLRRDKQQNA